MKKTIYTFDQVKGILTENPYVLLDDGVCPVEHFPDWFWLDVIGQHIYRETNPTIECIGGSFFVYADEEDKANGDHIQFNILAIKKDFQLFNVCNDAEMNNVIRNEEVEPTVCKNGEMLPQGFVPIHDLFMSIKTLNQTVGSYGPNHKPWEKVTVNKIIDKINNLKSKIADKEKDYAAYADLIRMFKNLIYVTHNKFN
jgi:hypothetical protein